MSTSERRVAEIVNEWFQGLPTATEQQRDRSGLIRTLAAELDRAKEDELKRAEATERVRIVYQVRQYAETVRHGTNDLTAAEALAAVIGSVADRISEGTP